MWNPLAEFCQPYSLGLVPKLYLYIHFVAAHQSVVSPTFTVHGSSDHMGDQCLLELWLLFPHPRKPVYLCSVSCIPHGCLSQGASDAQAHMVISSPSAPTTINGLQTACSTMSPSTLKLLSAGTPPSHLTPSVQSHPRWALVTEGYACLLAVACKPHLDEGTQCGRILFQGAAHYVFHKSSHARHFFQYLNNAETTGRGGTHL